MIIVKEGDKVRFTLYGDVILVTADLAIVKDDKGNTHLISLRDLVIIKDGWEI